MRTSVYSNYVGRAGFTHSDGADERTSFVEGSSCDCRSGKLVEQAELSEAERGRFGCSMPRRKGSQDIVAARGRDRTMSTNSKVGRSCRRLQLSLVGSRADGSLARIAQIARVSPVRASPRAMNRPMDSFIPSSAPASNCSWPASSSSNERSPSLQTPRRTARRRPRRCSPSCR